MKAKTCKSQDICERYIDGRCKVVKLIRVDVVSCSQRELTPEGKLAVKKGIRK